MKTLNNSSYYRYGLMNHGLDSRLFRAYLNRPIKNPMVSPIWLSKMSRNTLSLLLFTGAGK